jgi:hypothetical protein
MHDPRHALHEPHHACSHDTYGTYGRAQHAHDVLRRVQHAHNVHSTNHLRRASHAFAAVTIMITARIGDVRCTHSLP